jgi:hypothetical protein
MSADFLFHNGYRLQLIWLARPVRGLTINLSPNLTPQRILINGNTAIIYETFFYVRGVQLARRVTVRHAILADEDVRQSRYLSRNLFDAINKSEPRGFGPTGLDILLKCGCIYETFFWLFVDKIVCCRLPKMGTRHFQRSDAEIYAQTIPRADSDMRELMKE